MLSKQFLEEIKAKNIVLFLGAGASYGAKHADNNSIPSGQQLSDLIAEKFLGSEYVGNPLATVAELAANESSLFNLQSFIYEIISAFEPSEFQLKIPLFPWHAIFTTNYDMILELAYERNKGRVQTLHSIVRNTPYNQLPKNEKTLLYYKLHGSLSVINDINLPLILTVDQFLNHQNGRDRLFARFLELAYDFPILFVGFSMTDPDIRFMLQQVEKLKGGKPMYYIVSPMITEIEERYWSSRRFTVFKMSFEEFLNEIEQKITANERILGSIRVAGEYPIFEKFRVDIKGLKITQGLESFLNDDVEYVHRNIPSPNTDPKSFYKGYFENWDPILKNLDAKRGVSDGLLFEIFLNESLHSSTDPYFYLINGNAGSGKSVVLKRVAFEAATEIGRTCIFLKRYSKISIDPIAELYNYLKERIYLFIDNVSQVKKDVENLLKNASKLSIPLTIIATERTNIWNTECDELCDFLTDDYTLKYLSDKEITELLILLDKHNSLGALKFKKEEEKISLLREKSGRELLVALYEATNSKPFEEIILDEYNSITNPTAKSLYLTVSILHRLGAEARAGLISRVHGISFSEFKDKLFKPLEYIVFNRKNPKIDDYVYLTRHKQVAEFIFTLVLKTPQERFDEYVRLIRNLNLDFEADRIAYLAMTNARQLMTIFPDPQMVRNFYDIAEENILDKNKMYQQKAIFEMNSAGGSLVIAERFLREASKDGNGDLLIEHSLAELVLKKAENAKYDNEFYSNIDEVISKCNKIISDHRNNIPPYHTILKAIILKLKKVINESDDATLQRTLREAEKYFAIAKQVDSTDSFILEAESTFNEIINNKPNAKELLKRAFEKNRSSPFIALRYAAFLMQENDNPTALQAISDALQNSPHDKDLNFRYAEILMLTPSSTIEEVLHYLRRSFTMGDSRFHAQFMYGRALFINKQYDEARTIFNKLKTVKINPNIKNNPRARIREVGKVVEYTGEIGTFYYNYGTITRDKYGDKIFFRTADALEAVRNFKRKQKVSFNIAFNYWGAMAVNIKNIAP